MEYLVTLYIEYI